MADRLKQLAGGRVGRRTVAGLAGLSVVALALLGTAGAAGSPGLHWPWLGGAGGKAAGGGLALSAVIGQPAAGLATGAWRLCAGAGCAEEAAAPAVTAPPPATPLASAEPAGSVYLPWLELGGP